MWVSATWWPEGVPLSTGQLLERRFKMAPELRRYEIDMPAGKTVLFWKPNAKYSDNAFRSIMAWSGITSYNGRLKVRGVIEVKERQLYLISLGDGTEFPLYSQHQSANLRPALQQNELDPLVKLRLEAAAKKHQLVTIEGPLFMSLRPPVGIIVEHMEITDE